MSCICVSIFVMLKVISFLIWLTFFFFWVLDTVYSGLIVSCESIAIYMCVCVALRRWPDPPTRNQQAGVTTLSQAFVVSACAEFIGKLHRF